MFPTASCHIIEGGRQAGCRQIEQQRRRFRDFGYIDRLQGRGGAEPVHFEKTISGFFCIRGYDRKVLPEPYRAVADIDPDLIDVFGYLLRQAELIAKQQRAGQITAGDNEGSIKTVFFPAVRLHDEFERDSTIDALPDDLPSRLRKIARIDF